MRFCKIDVLKFTLLAVACAIIAAAALHYGVDRIGPSKAGRTRIDLEVFGAELDLADAKAELNRQLSIPADYTALLSPEDLGQQIASLKRAQANVAQKASRLRVLKQVLSDRNKKV